MGGQAMDESEVLPPARFLITQARGAGRRMAPGSLGLPAAVPRPVPLCRDPFELGWGMVGEETPRDGVPAWPACPQGCGALHPPQWGGLRGHGGWRGAGAGSAWPGSRLPP